MKLEYNFNVNKNLLYEILGWYGVIAVIVAYVFLNLEAFTAESLFYQFLNFSGGIGIMIIAFHKKDTQSAIVNLVWAFIAVFGILQIFY
jgi:hypothetical protein